MFISYFALPRFMLGGYHANSYRNCFIISNTIFIVELFFSFHIANNLKITIILFFFTILSYTYMVWYTFHRLSIPYRKMFLLLIIIEALFLIVMFFFPSKLSQAPLAAESTIIITLLKLKGEK